MQLRSLFQQYLAPTSPEPISLHVTHAEGNYLYSEDKKYLDLIGGISVCNIGHRHPQVIAAIEEQLQKYLHVMVYGELKLSPQILYAQALIDSLGSPYEMVYFTNSGSEAIEAAMKLAKRYTGRRQIWSFKNAYHGSTQGALSILGDEYWRSAYRPLLPEIYQYDYNDDTIIEQLCTDVAAVVVEAVQAEAGVLSADQAWLSRLYKKCKELGVLLIMDEVQTGFGRTGTMYAHTQYKIQPDILVLGKALGAGMPLGAITASRELLETFSHNPVLGHITTFGGHPVSCAAGLAGLRVLEESDIIAQSLRVSKALESVDHRHIVSVQSRGLWAAIFFESFEFCLQVCKELLAEDIFTDWFLFAQNAIRISPPLTLTEEEMAAFIQKLYHALDRI